jgi:uncharacterized protein
MRIELDKLEGTGGHFAHAYEPEELVLDDDHVRLTGAPEVSGRASRHEHQVRLRGRITARAEVDCDRCLKSLDIPVETSFDVSYVPAADYTLEPEAAELQEEDLSLSVFDGEVIDLDDLVREQVLLALPTRALCRDECQGLCPICGLDKNNDSCGCESKEVDPRWAALKDLRF